MSSSGPVVLGPDQGTARWLGGIGVRFMVSGEQSGGGFSLVEHPMPPRALAAPMHRHNREDEYSYVLEGRVGADLGGEVVVGGPGDLIFKPRQQWHTFWNAADEPARILEVISPAGFERYFEQVAELGDSQPGRPDPAAILELAGRYELELDLESVPALCERHGLVFPSPPPG